jgi:tRNA modification GTPase
MMTPTATTIFALSSGHPPAAIAVVRISGPQAAAVLVTLGGALPTPRVATLRSLRAAEGMLLDRALVLWLPGPNTATGEDVAELHLHGGRAVVRGVLTALDTLAGLRAAEPGEFTRRAFENGRLDLIEAEGLADLLEAETELQRRQALAIADGGLSQQVQFWQARLLQIAAEVEALIDFSDEDDVGGTDLSAIMASVEALRGELTHALARPAAERLRDGFRVVIAGPPNAGKSTLLNVLIGRDAAIVSEQAGTTRDIIEAPVDLNGAPIVFIDTAGIRASTDNVESIGIQRALGAVERADLVLWTGEAADAPDRSVTLRLKADLNSFPAASELGVSAWSGKGLQELRELIVEKSRSALGSGNDPLLNARQRGCIDLASTALQQAGAMSDLVLLAEHLREARVAFDTLTGQASVDDMLDHLFGRFCLGK